MSGAFKEKEWGTVIVLGAVWGASECLLGIGLRACAASISGSIMTGVALFFLSSGRRVGGNAFVVVPMVVMAGLFKMFDAALLSLPLKHGAVANPIFSFVVEGAAFVALGMILRKRWLAKTGGRALWGGLTALSAAVLFPLVRFATGIPACVVAGTGIPLSLYYAPLAAGFSLLTVPLGFKLGEKISNSAGGFRKSAFGRIGGCAAPSLAVLFCLVLVALIRWL